MEKQELDHIDHSLFGREETNSSPGLFIKKVGGAGIIIPINLVSPGFFPSPVTPIFLREKPRLRTRLRVNAVTLTHSGRKRGLWGPDSAKILGGMKQHLTS